MYDFSVYDPTCNKKMKRKRKQRKNEEVDEDPRVPLYQQVLRIFVEEGRLPAGYRRAAGSPFDIGLDAAGWPVAVQNKARPGRAHGS